MSASVSALAPSFAPPAAARGATSGTIYTADEHGNALSRIDLRTGKVDTLAIEAAPHNVQFVPHGNLILATGAIVAGQAADAQRHGAHGSGNAGNGGSGHGGAAGKGKLIVFDAAHFLSGPRASIAMAGEPAHVIADAQGRFAYVTNSSADTLLVIDIANRRLAATVPTGAHPHGLRMSPDGKTIYVANTGGSDVSVIDVASRSQSGRIEVGPAPVQVGFTPDGGSAYVSLGDANEVAVIDTATAKVSARIAVGRGPIQVHATPDGRFVYVANQGTETDPDDTVSVIDVADGKVVKTITTDAGAHGVAVSGDGKFVFVSNVFADTVSQIAVESQSVIRTYGVGKGPNGITYQA